MSLLEWLSAPPGSTIFILCLAMLLSFVISLINRLRVSQEQLENLNAWKREIESWKSDLIRAKRAGDKKQQKRLQKKEKRIKQLESKMLSQSLGQMKTMPIMFFSWILIWGCLTGRFLFWQLFVTPFSGGGNIAYLPWFDGPLPLDLMRWYILCSFASSILFSRVFGRGRGATE